MRHFLRLGLFLSLCSVLVVSTSAQASTTPKEEEQVTQIPENVSWKQALITSGKDGGYQLLHTLKYFTPLAIALYYINPDWRLTHFFGAIGDPRRSIPPLITMCGIRAISLRYNKQIHEWCGDASILMPSVASIYALWASRTTSFFSGLALIGALNAKESRDNRNISIIQTTYKEPI